MFFVTVTEALCFIGEPHSFIWALQAQQRVAVLAVLIRSEIAADDSALVREVSLNFFLGRAVR